MFGFLSRIFGIDSAAHKEVLRRIDELRDEKQAQGERLNQLMRMTLDGEDEWFMTLVKRGIKENPECIPRIVESCLDSIVKK
jgi:hypothetical protein